MAPLLSGHVITRSDRLLRPCLDIALDWIRQHTGAKNVSSFAWYDMAVASRAALLGYLLAQSGEVITAAERDILTDAAVTHARWLSASKNYKARHNHGLFSDAGLLMLCKSAPGIDECSTAVALAHDRFRETLLATVSSEGVHLEHSVGYHFDVLDLVERKLAVDMDPEVARVRDAMRKVAPWFVMPDGTYPQAGDTHRQNAPDWAVLEAVKKRGSQRFGTGYFAVREDESYLLVTASHNGSAHKHLDDLSFVLVDGGQPLLVDPGLYGYESAPIRSYLKSAAAHNTLVIDQHHRLPSPPYGGTLVASGEDEGWYAVWGRNAATAPGVAHERVWLYRPGQALLLVDLIESTDGAEHDHVRYLHFPAEVAVSVVPRGARIKAPSGSTYLALDASHEPPVRVDHVIGRTSPTPHGFVAPTDLTAVPASVIELWGRSRSTDLLTVLTSELGEVWAETRVRREAPEALRVTLGSSELLVRIEATQVRIEATDTVNGLGGSGG
jgi:hypothetical protein